MKPLWEWQSTGQLSMAETFRYAAVGTQGAVLNHAVPAHTGCWYSASLKSLSPPRGSWTPSAQYGGARWSPGWRWWRGAACCPGWTPRMLSRFPVCRWWLHPEYKHGSLDETTIHRKPVHVYEDKPKLVQTKNPALGNGLSTITLNFQCGCSEHALFPTLQATTGGVASLLGGF